MTLMRDIKDNFNEFKAGMKEALDSIDYLKTVKKLLNDIQIKKLNKNRLDNSFLFMSIDDYNKVISDNEVKHLANIMINHTATMNSVNKQFTEIEEYMNNKK